MKTPSEPLEISVVVPVLDEEESLPLLVPQLIEVLKGLDRSYEVVFVDDGSSDRSSKILNGMISEYSFLRIIRFKENRGSSAALVAGVREARGGSIVTLDSDLQNDPADIPKLLRYLDHYDMAAGWRQKRKDPWLKRISSKIANAIRNRLSGEKINDSVCPLRVFKKECFREIPKFNGMHRFLPTLMKMEGYRVVEVPVSHHPRRFGKSKYNIRNRMWRSFIDLLAVRWMKSRHIHFEIEERR
ncbi:MAG: glycosyl transferase [Deltaproteobacteria bacterium RBG_16_48_10]|nr:MAG: glycosyl transferase [Deltaproteobacteria bacterium RBG_16_48_10]